MALAFDPAAFKADYPDFNYLSDAKLSNTFEYNAAVIGQCVSANFVEDDVKMYWLQVVLAHILQLEHTKALGRVVAAKQGSESVNTDFDVSKDLAWWSMTVYGQQCIMVITEYTSGGHYVSDGNTPYTGRSMDIWG